MEEHQVDAGAMEAARREEAMVTLRADLEVAAAAASGDDEPLYRFLGQLAEDRRPIPMWQGHPNVSEVARRLKLRRTLVERFAEALAEWEPRFHEALTGAPRPRFPDGLLAAATSGQASPAEIDHELICDLESAMSTAAADERIAYEWLIARARIGAPLPLRGKRANMKMISRDMGMPVLRVAEFTDLMNRWVPRFPTVPMGRVPRRRTLPGCESMGTDVPAPTLIAGLRNARAEAIDTDALKMLDHLLSIAENDRLVPRVLGGAALTQLLRDAGVERTGRHSAARRVLHDWVEFFGLHAQQTQLLSDGSNESRDVLLVRLTDFISELRKDDLTPLRSSARRPFGPSYAWLAEELNVPASRLMKGKLKTSILDYWEEAGPGLPYEGRTAGAQMALNTRRKALLDWVKEEIAAGRPLPLSRRPGAKLDHDEMVRRSGRPGPNLANDDWFKAQLRRLKPRFERVKYAGGLPATYAQLIDGILRERLKNATTKASRNTTRSWVNSAIGIFHRHFGKEDTAAIGDDFTSADFDGLLEKIVATGTVTVNERNWRSELNGAKRWFDARLQDDMLGDELDMALRAAVERDGRTLNQIINGIDGLGKQQLTGWMRGDSLPSKEAVHLLQPLAIALKLPPDRFSRLLGADPHNSGHRSEVIVPAGVHKYLPDSWTTRPIAEQKAMISWIDDNLVHSNSMFGHTMRAVAAQRSAARRERDGAAAEYEEDAALSLDDEQEVADGGDTDDGLSAEGAAIGAYLDKAITTDAVGLGDRVSAELRELRHHMTVDFPRRYLRRKGAKWQSDSTAPMKLGLIRRFLRWQTLPEDKGGLGRNPDDLTLADLIHPPLVFAFIDHKARALENVEYDGIKRGKVFTGSEVDLLRTFGSLVSREYGFITQRADLAARVTADERPLPVGSFITLSGHVFDKKERRMEDGSDLSDDDDDTDEEMDELEHEEDGWDEDESVEPMIPSELCGLDAVSYVEACRRAQLAYESAAHHVEEEADNVRDPAEAIQPILDSPQPMTTLLRQLALAGRSAPSRTRNPLSHHLHKRDLLMTRLLALTSLRSKNLRQITVDGRRPKLTWDVQREMWLLEIHWREFKNYRSSVLFGRRQKRQKYRKWLPDTQGLYDLIRYYLDYSRPFLKAAGDRYWAKKGKRKRPSTALFITSHGRRLRRDGTWKVIRSFTARHVAWNPFRDTGVPNCQPFGPHAFRDIRATDILLNPETSDPFLEAAYALQTSPQMIQNHYGVIKTERRTEMDDVSFIKRESLAYAGLEDV